MRKNYRLQMQKALRNSVTHSGSVTFDSYGRAHCPECSGLLQATEVSALININSLDDEDALFFAKWFCSVCQTSITSELP
jgi:hypothetical protein